MSPETLRILEKVKKLFALANDAGAAEGERDNALRMAQALLRKHNLDEKQVGFAGLKIHKTGQSKKVPAWCETVFNGVAKVFGCFVFMDGNIAISGSAASIATVEYVALHLCEEIKRKSQAAASAQFMDALFSGNLETRKMRESAAKQFNEDFCKGAAKALYAKCLEIAGEAEEETRALAEDFCKSQFKIKERKRTLTLGAGAHAGAEFGRTLNPSAQVGAKAPLRLK